MKKALRVIVPLILALILVACAAWYFLVYDQAFTKELLLTTARKFEDAGKYKISAFIYDVTYYQSSKDDDVAIELTQQYLDMGNFTKAEYTLTNAIRTKPTADLYAALSMVFVQQDKLMDAVNLLNGVSDPAISKELEAMRPKAPVLTPEPGFYDQYITVEVHSDGANLYVSTDADYPSILKDAYTGPLTLTTGETVIHALAVNSKGLVSQLTISGYTIQGVIEQIKFTDPSMEQAIRMRIEATPTEPIYTNQLWDVTEFTVPAEATSFEDLQYLPHLKSLEIPKESQGDLSCLDTLEELEALSLNGRRLSEGDMERIAQHTGLKKLSLSGCSLSSVQTLAPLTQLVCLDLSANTLRNISIVTAMPGLQELYLANNVITDLSVLSGLTKLQHLDIAYNSVSSLSPLSSINSLVSLIASHNQISSTAGIANHGSLELLDLSHNSISDISGLAVLANLIELRANNNALTSMAGLQNLLHLRILDLSYNQITELPAFQKNCELVNINMAHNLLLKIDQLADLPWLNTVNIDYNEEVEDLLPLDSCPVLVRVNAFGTNVTEVSFLTAKSIIVNFDPTLEDK